MFFLTPPGPPLCKINISLLVFFPILRIMKQRNEVPLRYFRFSSGNLKVPVQALLQISVRKSKGSRTGATSDL